MKKISPLKSEILQIFIAIFNAYLKFTGNVNEISDQWRFSVLFNEKRDVQNSIRIIAGEIEGNKTFIETN